MIEWLIVTEEGVTEYTEMSWATNSIYGFVVEVEMLAYRWNEQYLGRHLEDGYSKRHSEAIVQDSDLCRVLNSLTRLSYVDVIVKH